MFLRSEKLKLNFYPFLSSHAPIGKAAFGILRQYKAQYSTEGCLSNFLESNKISIVLIESCYYIADFEVLTVMFMKRSII
jgi:hypothetical protein